MMKGDPGTRAATLLGVGFSVFFTVALTALFGDLVGAFADSSSTFTYSDSSTERLRHAVGAYTLTASGLMFMAFVVRVIETFEAGGAGAAVGSARGAAAAFAALTGCAAAAFATVSLSVGFGRLTGDPGIQEGRDLLPQLGYVLLFVPAALCAGYAVLVVARGAAQSSRLPGWVVGAGYVAAVAQLFSFYTLPVLLLPLWLLAAAITLRPPSAHPSANV